MEQAVPDQDHRLFVPHGERLPVLQLFMKFITNTFPTFHAYNNFRETDYPSFAAGIISSLSENFLSLDDAAYCVSLVFQDQWGVEASSLLESREAYDNAIQGVALACDPAQNMSKPGFIGAIILLSIYEMRARTIPDGWLNHARGVEAHMEQLGAPAFRHGLARSCFILFRGFLIASAFRHGQPCFLEERQWLELSEWIRIEDSQKTGNDTELVDIIESVFMELVKFPRYVYEARLLQRAPHNDQMIDLCTRVLDSRKNLMSQVGWLEYLFNINLLRANHNLRFSAAALTVQMALLHGAECAVRLSEDLAIRVTMKPIPPFHVSSGLAQYIDAGHVMHDAAWLDYVACSMGWVGTRVIDEDEP
ncbi:hypothetical protein BDV28DRAFT_164154 [Aspergillus coremiiformis]|uniref:Transcription factor domain-containing protein n=1 Tax=Aspergillus coremiiformis TaxID=138285 RepID=A0A5N6ZA12_9EURO|nr:hypothetical protein BDV28DRAFT_164154 [Aspergillus coremiiformis]